ncbi:MAG: hypothetical protein LIR40_08010 [Bacteroidota bacterium]|nr:hypothetical protein [Bacteroidota bacterium]
MKAKLFVCDDNDTYKSVHNMYASKSYEQCTVFDILIEDVDVECGSSNFNNFTLKYRPAGLKNHTTCSICSWQNFLLKFENDEVAELHRTPDVLYRHDDCTANRDAVSRFKEDIAIAVAGKPEVIFSEEEDFIV